MASVFSAKLKGREMLRRATMGERVRELRGAITRASRLLSSLQMMTLS